MITCKINPKHNDITLFETRHSELEPIGQVWYDEGEPTIYMYNKDTRLTFSDIAVIQDNWENMQEIRTHENYN